MRDKLKATLEGYGVRMRPVVTDDAAFIIATRHMSHAIGKVSNLDITVAQEKGWLQKCIQDPHDYFFIIESLDGMPLGTFGVYDIDFDAKAAEIGRVVTIPGSVAYIPARILLTDFSFEQLGLEKLIVHAVSTNKKVIAFNMRIGSDYKGVIKRSRVISGQKVDMVRFELTCSQWQENRQMLIEIAKKSMQFIKA